MTGDLTLAAALGAGLVGSTHCLGMCGGIAAALGVGARTGAASHWIAASYAVLFNLGRILSYALIGAIAGALGSGLVSATDLPVLSAVTRGLTGVLMILIGLQIAFGWSLLRFIEESGARFWRRLAPLAKRMMPVTTPVHALALGMLWGWLPCGLVYSVLLMALLAGDAGQSAALMAAFGVGTLPAMTVTGLAGARLKLSLGRPGVRLAAGLLLVIFGIWTGFGPLQHVTKGQHQHHGAVRAAEPAVLC